MAGSIWRVSLRRRLSGLVATAGAEAVAIAVVATGPRESFGFSLRLPVLVLVIGALAVAARRRRMIVVGRDELVVRTLARTRRIPWPDVTSVLPRATRITVSRLNDRGFTLRTGADTSDVAGAIEAALAAARADVAAGADLQVADLEAMAVRAGITASAWRAIQPPPVATPWLVLNGTMGVAVLAAKGYENNPALMAGLLGFGAAACLATLGGCLVQWLRSCRRTADASALQ